MCLLNRDAPHCLPRSKFPTRSINRPWCTCSALGLQFLDGYFPVCDKCENPSLAVPVCCTRAAVANDSLRISLVPVKDFISGPVRYLNAAHYVFCSQCRWDATLAGLRDTTFRQCLFVLFFSNRRLSCWKFIRPVICSPSRNHACL